MPALDALLYGLPYYARLDEAELITFTIPPLLSTTISRDTPGDAFELLVSMTVTLVTGVAAGNRTIRARYDDVNTHELVVMPTAAEQGPDLIGEYLWTSSLAAAVVGASSLFPIVVLPWPAVLMTPDGKLTVDVPDSPGTDTVTGADVVMLRIPTGPADQGSIAPLAQRQPSPMFL